MPRLTLNKTGSGTGRVRSLLAGIDCGPGCTAQHADYARWAQVILVATPSAGSHFTGWSGDGVDVLPPGETSVARQVGMNRERTVAATFTSGSWVLPDLVIDRLRFEARRSGDASTLVRFSLRVKNIGGAPSAPGTVRLRVVQQRWVLDPQRRTPRPILLDQTLNDEQAVGTLLPGRAKSFERAFSLAPQIVGMRLRTAPSFEAVITATADSGGSTTEGSESNNTGLLRGTLQDGTYA